MEADPDAEREAEPYRNVADFAFFAVNFGYSKKEYEELTPTERKFILKAWEDRTVSWTTLVRDAVLNAVTNAFRKKGKRFQKLWKKRSSVSMEDIREYMRISEKVKRETGNNWIDRIRKANGMRR